LTFFGSSMSRCIVNYTCKKVKAMDDKKNGWNTCQCWLLLFLVWEVFVDESYLNPYKYLTATIHYIKPIKYIFLLYLTKCSGGAHPKFLVGQKSSTPSFGLHPCSPQPWHTGVPAHAPPRPVPRLESMRAMAGVGSSRWLSGGQWTGRRAMAGAGSSRRLSVWRSSVIARLLGFECCFRTCMLGLGHRRPRPRYLAAVEAQSLLGFFIHESLRELRCCRRRR
jgi:hypothetical protein